MNDDTQNSAAGAEFRGRIYDSIVDTIGATPLIRLGRLMADAGCNADILAKCEFFNPLASVKDRIGASMIAAAERDGGEGQRVGPGRGDGLEGGGRAEHRGVDGEQPPPLRVGGARDVDARVRQR